jgi:hypothetical protein
MYEVIVKKLDAAVFTLEESVPFHILTYINEQYYLIFRFQSYEPLLAFYLDTLNNPSYQLLGIFEEGLFIEPSELYDLITALDRDQLPLSDLIAPYYGRAVTITI